jgi:hypothetical protein
MLLLFTERGCPACATALPEFERYRSRNPMQMALVLDADGPYAAHFVKKAIRATPFYMLRSGDDGQGAARGVMHAGVMRAEQLEKWVGAAMKAIGEAP